MYDHILLPLAPELPNNTARAVNAARAMLNDDGTLTPLIVLEVPPGYAAQFLTEDQIEELVAREKSRLVEEGTALTGVEPKIVLGHPARTILDEAEENGIDCIVISSHRPGLSDYLLGSTAQRVVRRANCSVHVLR